MEFGIFDHLDNDSAPLKLFYQDRLNLIELYDRFGFHAYHLAEHHGTTLGMAPSPNVFLSSVAQRTQQLRFGPMVYALPLYHPMRLTEEICMLDQLSGGRLDIGFGRGLSPVEISYFGVDPEKTEEIFRTNQPRILEAIESGILRVEDQGDPYKKIELKVSALQKPTPRVWYGVHTPESAERAALRAWHTINLDTAHEAAECSEVYRRVWRDTHGERPLPLMGLGRFIVVGDTDEHALSIARRAYPIWLRGFTHLFRVLGRMPRHPRPETWDMLCEQGKGIAGRPETVLAFLSDQHRSSGCNYCVGQFAFGDQTLPEMQRSVELFATEVMPSLREVQPASETV